MTSQEIRQRFLAFFEKRGHVIVPSSSLVPDDPSVLLTTAGMQQFKKYFTGELDFAKEYPGKLGAASIQKSFRTSDIDEVGDETHLTFFEMLGNFSFGGYFKKEAIEFAHEFITKEMGLEISYVTIFEGNDSIGVPQDEESKKIWQSLDPNTKIIEQGMDDVFWGPTGSSGPCGPTTEIYCKNTEGKEVEVWNIVFNEYFFLGSREELNSGTSDKKLEPLKTPGVDTGMGLERLAMIVQKKKNIFETDLFESIFRIFPSDFGERQKRIIADHARAIVFLIADGVRPSNKQQDYILRRLMRRMIAQQAFGSSGLMTTGLGKGIDMSKILEKVTELYRSFYPNLESKTITPVFEEETTKYGRAIEEGVKEISKMEGIDAGQAFYLFQSFGLPFEAVKDIAGNKARNLNREAFDAEFKKHQDASRAGAEKKFGGHGLILNTGELKAATEEEVIIVTRLHTATHMLQQALRDVLGPEVHQMGSDITAERTRFDFTFGRKLTQEEIKKVEDRVNEKIKEDLPVAYVELPRAEAEKTGALFFSARGGSSFGGQVAKYGDVVKVYYIGRTLDDAWSKEFCGGPHVSHTSEVGKFKIAKEEAVAAGVRRIRGTVE